MPAGVVITGIGMVTPLGHDPRDVLRRIEAGESAAAPPAHFDATPFACPVCAEVKDFQPQSYVPEPKMLRLMNRDAQLAVAAAHLALQDARLKVGADYAPEDIGLFGATGLAGLPLGDVAPLIRASIGPDGHFDLVRFGQRGLRSISPLLSFKILGNMPLCFVSICENIQGPNGIYTPWESQGAQAIEAGLRAILRGEARCALVGGCDVKTHELAFLSLQQWGFFNAWHKGKTGTVPGEGAIYLVIEKESDAQARNARSYARIWFADYLQPKQPGRYETEDELLQLPYPLNGFVCTGDHEAPAEKVIRDRLSTFLLPAAPVLYPKKLAGNLFAAAAVLEVGLAALMSERNGGLVLADCRLQGRQRRAFFLEKP